MYSDGDKVSRYTGCLIIFMSVSVTNSKNIEEVRHNIKKLHQAYMNDLLQHGESNVLVTDEMGYLHEDTLQYIIYKIHQILYEQLSKQSLMKAKLGYNVPSSELELLYEINKDINERERHKTITRFKYEVLEKLRQLYANIFLKQIPQLRENIQKEIYNIDYRKSKKLVLHMNWEFQDSFNAQVNLLSKVVHSIIRKVIYNIEAGWYKANATNILPFNTNQAKLQYLKS